MMGAMDSKLETEPAGAHRRMATTLAGMRRRLLRRRPGASEPVWTAAMSRWLAAGLVLALLVSLFDAAAIRFVQGPGAGEAAVRLMAWITNIGRSQWYLVPSAAVLLVVGLLDWSRKTRRGRARLSFLLGQAAYVFAAVAVSGLFVDAVKIVFGRARPRLIDEVGAWHFDPFTFGYVNASFPSGHSATVGAMVGVLMIWFPRWSLVILEFGLFFAATRIAAQAHYPSDVATGFGTGLFFSIVIARWLAVRGAVFRLVPEKILPAPARRP
jgi:undecaprenyl-diphosphatase